MKVGFIGLGRMGAGMAISLLKAGHDVTVYNRTRTRAESLTKHGATVADDIAGACSGDAVFTMLANDAAVENVVLARTGIVKHLAPGAIHISSSTISVPLSERIARAHADAGQRFVAALVFGRPEAAAVGNLFLVAAGAPDAIALVTSLFDAVGQRTFIVGKAPDSANLVKLSGNFLIACVIEALGEAIALIEKGGLDKRQYLEVLTSTLFGAPVYKTYGALIVDGKFEPAGFAAPLGQKDVRLVLAAADNLGVTMPFANLLRDRFVALLASGGEELDWSAIGALAAREAGITGLST